MMFDNSRHFAQGRRAANRRRAFTLIELLVTMVIIAILSMAMIAALSGARETARQIRAKQLVARLTAQIQPKYESYRIRPLPVNPIDVLNINLDEVALDTSGVPERRRKQIAWFKLWGMRELMRMELPDTYADLTFEPQILRSPSASGDQLIPYRPAAWYMFQDEIRVQRRQGETDQQLLARVDARNQPSECLYMIVSSSLADRDLYNVCFTDADVGDTDSDGMPEFIDGWGNPIQFIRWPAGFVSDLQPLFSFRPGARVPGTTTISYSSVYGTHQPKDPTNPTNFLTRLPVTGSSDNDRVVVLSSYRDPFDPLFSDRWEPNPANRGSFSGIEFSGQTAPVCSWYEPPNPSTPGPSYWGFPERSYSLYPLIFSMGADGESGLAFFTSSSGQPQSEFLPTTFKPGGRPHDTWTNPYLMVMDQDNEGSRNIPAAMRQRGTPTMGGMGDNIHNHHLAP